MFSSDFYPTPLNVLEMMGFDPKNKIVLEPSAGKGDVVDYCYNNGAKKVLTYELNYDLREILKTKSIVLGSDFLEANNYNLSHIDLIIMNPPFKNADKHILKAWEIAPEGCEIYALCNYETINKAHLYVEVNTLINDYGTVQNLGNCFSTAERKTNVDIGLIKLTKPNYSNPTDFSGFFMEDEYEEDSDEIGIMPYNEVRALVNRYVSSIKIFDQMELTLVSLNYMLSQIKMSEVSFSIGYKQQIKTRQEFIKTLQKESWKHIFDKFNMQKYMTSGVMKDVNKFVETQEKVPFTMKNIYKMIEIIIGTRYENYNRALVEAIDNFTRNTHENRFGVEGWKTNNGYMLNKKIIVPGIMQTLSFMGFRPKYDSNNGDKINDLNKVLCNVMGYNYDNIGDIYHIEQHIGDISPNTWYSWGFFEIKFFKKGTAHLKFNDTNVWYQLNAAYGKLKGFSLPETYRK